MTLTQKAGDSVSKTAILGPHCQAPGDRASESDAVDRPRLLATVLPSEVQTSSAELSCLPTLSLHSVCSPSRAGAVLSLTPRFPARGPDSLGVRGRDPTSPLHRINLSDTAVNPEWHYLAYC